MLLRYAFALATLLVAFGPGSALAQTVAVSDPEAYHKGVSRDELKKFRELYEASLRKAGLGTVSAHGKKNDLRSIEFVTSLSVGRAGGDFIITGQVSRIRLDAWAARSESRSPQGDAAALGNALDQVATAVAGFVRNAPPRSTAQPPRKPRENRRRQDSDDPKAPIYGKGDPSSEAAEEEPPAE